MARACIQLATGFEEMEAVAVTDIFRRAGIEAIMVSMTNDLLVAGAQGITIKADALFSNVDYSSIDMIVLPGGKKGSSNLAEHEGLRQTMHQFAVQGKYLGAICAAPMVFGRMGLLKGKAAVCYPGFENELEGAEIATGNVAQAQNIITSKGPATAVQFSLTLVEVLLGKEAATKVRQALLA